MHRALCLLRIVLCFVAVALGATLTRDALAQLEPAACRSMNPSDWPAPSKPYFMIAFDTSGSMAEDVGGWPVPTNSCGYGGGTSTVNATSKNAHGRCAIAQTITAFAGEVNFGLSGFARIQSSCTGGANGCFTDCALCNFDGNATGDGCGPRSSTANNNESRQGAHVLVPMASDLTHDDNVAELLSWTDNSCAGSTELWADGYTPLNGVLRDMYRYFSNQWVEPTNSCGATAHTYASPLGRGPTGTPPDEERDCRSVNVILVTDGVEYCDNAADAPDAAKHLNDGFTHNGIFWRVRTHVIDFGNTGGASDAIADMGDNGVADGSASAYAATDEASLAQALATIISTANQPEICDNRDNNCNGCTDEGYAHYCDIGQTCFDCVTHTGYATEAACRTGQLSLYRASVSAADPDGDLTLLPCTTTTQQAQPANWLCYNPRDACDNTVDNNCDGNIDEGQTKCGSPPTCPTPETCDGKDNNCDGLIDPVGTCPNNCHVTAETCDCRDNDCDGHADNGTFGTSSCGLPSPSWCQGTLSCAPPQDVPIGGTASPPCGYQCTYAPGNGPRTEDCNGIDDDCSGIIDDNLTPGKCQPTFPGFPQATQFGDGDPIQCIAGDQVCVAGGWQCQGAIGPSAEVCDGIDNDCDGLVDDATHGAIPGVGLDCGSAVSPCVLGKTVCDPVLKAIVCQGPSLPQPEVCDGINNDCDLQTDEAPLADAPVNSGCWNLPGTDCSHDGFSWSPPPGGTCSGLGTLVAPCSQGTLTCAGAGGWTCVGGQPPGTEVCDDVDNNCDGNVDEQPIAGEGDLCGADAPPCTVGTPPCEGACRHGHKSCVNGAMSCVDEVPPIAELCDGIDNDCDGVADDGLPVGELCNPTYDVLVYPGDRSNLPCRQGVYECTNGAPECIGGVGPSPEVCDGIDNDCDGSIDETGPAPEGIDGTANPLPSPVANIGDVCGNDLGACDPGHYACLNGLFACLGGTLPAVEQCDCVDNDCDGSTDELPTGQEPALCSAGKDCVNAGSYCVCAEKCGTGEYPCPGGQNCIPDLPVSGTATTGNYCIPIFCGDCALETVHGSANEVLCAPAGTDAPGCLQTPVCVCRGQVGCERPCRDVDCPSGTVCSNFGPTPGKCVTDTCYLTGCSGCDRACHEGDCVDNPCTAATCAPEEVCKPSADYTSHSCVGTCADVVCDSTHQCVEGQCLASCDPACGDGQTCDLNAVGGPACVTDLCFADGGATACADGACCHPLTGICGDCPCEGVVCPTGQVCQRGECVGGGAGGGGGGGSGPGGSGPGGSGTGATHQGGGSTPPTDTSGVWRLSSGGGGCLCGVGPGRRSSQSGWLGLIALGLVLGSRRTGIGRRRAQGKEVQP